MSLNVAVIGAGVQGRSFAAACALAGFAVVLEDVMPARLRDAGKVFAELGQSVALVTTVEDAVRDADVVVDFVPDELESKLEIWSLMDRMAPPRTVMCTPSEGAEPDGSGLVHVPGGPLCDGAGRPGRRGEAAVDLGARDVGRYAYLLRGAVSWARASGSAL